MGEREIEKRARETMAKRLMDIAGAIGRRVMRKRTLAAVSQVRGERGRGWVDVEQLGECFK